MNQWIIIMPRFQPTNYDQATMVVVNFDNYIHPGTFEYALHYLIENVIDVSVFDAAYNNDETGRTAYDPKVLLKIILFAYYKGVTSSREIDWCCQTNVTFMALSCQSTPHWTTIAQFVSSHPQAIKSVFTNVLLVCETQGLLGHEIIAIDGCKLRSDASKQWSGTFDQLAARQRKIESRIEWAMSEQQRLDETGETDRADRQAQTVQTLSAAAAKISAFLEKEQPRIGTGKSRQEVKSNITDNDSAKMKTSKGVIQGYNGVTAVPPFISSIK
jgi:transposase